MRHDSKKLIRIVTRAILSSLVLFASLALAVAQEPGAVLNSDGSRTVTHPDGSRTVTYPEGSTSTTGIKDPLYGEGGTRDEERDPEGRVIRTTWKDWRGWVQVQVNTTYREDGIEVIARAYTYTPESTPDRRVGGISETIKRNDYFGREVYSETRIFDEKNQQTGGTKTEVDSRGRTRTYEWNPHEGSYMETFASATPVTQPDGGTTVMNSDGSSTTKGIPDDRYGSGGTRDEEKDVKGRVVQIVWKDGTKRSLESEETHHGLGNEKEVSTKTYNPTPGGGVRRSGETITRTDSAGFEISSETRIFDPKDGRQIGGSKTEVDPKGRKRTYEWDPQKGGYVEVVASVTPQASGQSKSSSAHGFAVASEVAAGLNTTIFATPRGKIRVNLPDDLAAGDTLSGTVIAEPQGKDDKERAANQGELTGYVVEMEKQEASSTSRILKLAIPAASSTTFLILKDKERKEVARIEVPVGLQPPLEEFYLPTLGQQGRAVEVSGRFDGDFSTTNVKVGGERLEVLAESPRKVVARNTSNKIGPTELLVEEQGRTATGEFRSLGLKLSAPKLDLLRGEQTTLTVKILGLEGLKEPVPLVLENKSPSVISMGQGNLEQISVSPSQVREGTYTIERSLTGIQRGAFTITATAISGCIPFQAPTSINGGTQKAAGTPGYTICGSGCQPPATEQGTGRIRCLTTKACQGRASGCKCHMFRRPMNTNQDYEHVENPEVYADRDGGYDYVCRCVK